MRNRGEVFDEVSEFLLSELMTRLEIPEDQYDFFADEFVSLVSRIEDLRDKEKCTHSYYLSTPEGRKYNAGKKCGDCGKIM